MWGHSEEVDVCTPEQWGEWFRTRVVQRMAHVQRRLAGAGNTGLLSAKYQPRDSLIPGLRWAAFSTIFWYDVSGSVGGVRFSSYPVLGAFLASLIQWWAEYKLHWCRLRMELGWTVRDTLGEMMVRIVPGAMRRQSFSSVSWGLYHKLPQT